MSGLDKIISRLEEECTSQCEAIELEAAKMTANTIADAKVQAEKSSEEIIAQAEKQSERIASRAQSAAQMNTRQSLLFAKVEIINGLTEKALEAMHNMEESKYFDTLVQLVKKNAAQSGGELMFSKRDLERLPSDFVAKTGKELTVSAIPCDIDDGFILKYGDIEINCTFKAMFSAVIDELKSTAGEILFS